MSSHRRTRTRRPRSGRLRAVASLGAVGFLALGLGAQGTFAFWTDQATVTTGSFSSGTLDITLNGQLAGAANNGGTTTLPSFALSNMVPGESQAIAFPVANNGSVGLTYTVNGSATGALAPGMQFTVATGNAGNTGTAANGNRTGTCSGGNLATNQVLNGTSSTVVGTARSLAVGAQESICVIARLDPQADNGLQGKTMTASLIFNAKQVGAP
ncbi:MAG: TasA family protein [Nocardioides sp.]|uniref:TasA family protein n=1 Tax=Nocardioides sp. TaxID=35761 RepID=UPI002388AFAC|nr:TasA family protein [Nocardioides sp.]MDE0778624.1 TasA family protein [Nocardioides sp.]